MNGCPEGLTVDANAHYEAWLAALARSNRAIAIGHAACVIAALAREEPEPAWTPDAKQSFDAWCAGEKLERRRPARRW